MPRCALLILLSVIGARAFGQAVTAPLSPDRPLSNAAAAVTRPFNSLSMHAGRETELTNVTDLVDSEYKVKMVVDSFVLNAAWTWRSLFLEANLSAQSGTKTTDNFEESAGGVQSNNRRSNKISLMPFQGLAGFRLGPSTSVGLKLLSSSANFDSDAKYRTRTSDITTDVDETSKVAAGFTVLGIGAVYNFQGNFYLSYAAEFTELKTTRQLEGESTTTSSLGEQVVVSSQDGTEKQKIRKDVFGLGYLAKKSAKEVLRAEISYTNMPPLNGSLGLKNGERISAVAEGTWSLFHVGAEMSTVRGFYVDPSNLIPYYFKFQNLSNSATQDFGVFGGFRSAKGHSVSLSYFMSNEKKKERLSFSDPVAHEIERKTASFGINYYYLF